MGIAPMHRDVAAHEKRSFASREIRGSRATTFCDSPVVPIIDPNYTQTTWSLVVVTATSQGLQSHRT
jgi:hypothetical protein